MSLPKKLPSFRRARNLALWGLREELGSFGSVYRDRNTLLVSAGQNHFFAVTIRKVLDPNHAYVFLNRKAHRVSRRKAVRLLGIDPNAIQIGERFDINVERADLIDPGWQRFFAGWATIRMRNAAPQWAVDHWDVV